MMPLEIVRFEDVLEIRFRKSLFLKVLGFCCLCCGIEFCAVGSEFALLGKDFIYVFTFTTLLSILSVMSGVWALFVTEGTLLDKNRHRVIFWWKVFGFRIANEVALSPSSTAVMIRDGDYLNSMYGGFHFGKYVLLRDAKDGLVSLVPWGISEPESHRLADEVARYLTIDECELIRPIYSQNVV